MTTVAFNYYRKSVEYFIQKFIPKLQIVTHLFYLQLRIASLSPHIRSLITVHCWKQSIIVIRIYFGKVWCLWEKENALLKGVKMTNLARNHISYRLG